MKKILLALSSAMFLFAACGSDDDGDSKNSNEISYVKSITYTDSEGDMEKITFTYEKNKLTSLAASYKEHSYVSDFTYTSDNSIKMVNNDEEGESILTLDPSTKNLLKVDSKYGEDVFTTNYSYKGVFLASMGDEEYFETYTWSNNNLTKIEEIYDGDVEGTVTVAYSDIDNNTNLDFTIWLIDEDPTALQQFITNISKKIPSTFTITEDGETEEVKISTSLDDKGRVAKMIIEDKTYTFEYYD